MLSYFRLASKYPFMAKDSLGALSYNKDEGIYFHRIYLLLLCLVSI